MVVEVTYDHFTGGRFRHGTKIVRWRKDKAPRQCTLDQVAPKKQQKALEIRRSDLRACLVASHLVGRREACPMARKRRRVAGRSADPEQTAAGQGDGVGTPAAFPWSCSISPGSEVAFGADPDLDGTRGRGQVFVHFAGARSERGDEWKPLTWRMALANSTGASICGRYGEPHCLIGFDGDRHATYPTLWESAPISTTVRSVWIGTNSPRAEFGRFLDDPFHHFALGNRLEQREFVGQGRTTFALFDGEENVAFGDAFDAAFKDPARAVEHGDRFADLRAQDLREMARFGFVQLDFEPLQRLGFGEESPRHQVKSFLAFSKKLSRIGLTLGSQRSANSLSLAFCAALSFVGTSTVTRTCKSPWP